MTTTTQKERELWFVKRAHELWPAFPEGKITQPDPPAPDAVVIGADFRNGFEVTELLWDRKEVGGSKIRAVESIRQQIVLAANRIWDEQRLPPISASVLWLHDHAVSKVEVATHASDLVRVVASHIPASSDYLHLAYPHPAWKELPKTVVSILLRRLNKSAISSWTVSGGGAVPDLAGAAAAIQQAVSAKERKIEGYRRYCDQLWLLVVAEGTHQGSYIAIDPEDEPPTVFSSFDRVLLLSVIHGSVLELPILSRP